MSQTNQDVAVKNNSVHLDHRKRMRERMLQFGADNFADHELLEILLYAANPRGNTNESAHALIERFGSIDRLMEASADELMEVSGIGEAGAVQILCATEMMRRMIRSLATPPDKFDSIQKIAEHMWSYFCALDHERLYMMLLDNQMAMVDFISLSDGTVTGTDVPTNLILTQAVKKKAAYVILGHNHPHGTARPSKNDTTITYHVEDMLSLVKIRLLEHIVMAGDCFWPILKNEREFSTVVSNLHELHEDCIDMNAFYNVDEHTYRFSEHFQIQ